MATRAPQAQPDETVIADRRRQVAALKLRGLTQREIQAGLPKLNPPVINLSTGEPWSIGTIVSDLQALREEWQATAAISTAEHLTQQLAELAELKRYAWQKGKLELVLKALAQEAKLTGTLAPVKFAPTNIQGDEPYRVAVKDLNADQLAAIISLTEPG